MFEFTCTAALSRTELFTQNSSKLLTTVAENIKSPTEMFGAFHSNSKDSVFSNSFPCVTQFCNKTNAVIILLKLTLLPHD